MVDLYIPQKEQTLRARVQWRHGDESGSPFPMRAAAASQPANWPRGRAARERSCVAAAAVKRLKSEIGGSDDEAARSAHARRIAQCGWHVNKAFARP